MSRTLQIFAVSSVTLLMLAACNEPGTSAKNETSPAAQTLPHSPVTKTESSPAAAATGVLATVNGTPITTSRVDELVKSFTSQNPGQSADAETRKVILEQLIMQTVIAQDAVQKGLDKKPEIVEKLELTRQSVLASALIQDYLTSHPVSDDAVRAEYDKAKAGIASTEYKARHILVDKEDTAKALIAKLKANPASFAALAKANSKDPGSKDKGGDLGWFDPHIMVPEFAEAVSKLQKGKMTEEPVHTKYGYHIITLDDTRQQAVPPLDQIKPMIRQRLQQQMVKSMLDELKAKAKIDMAAAPAASTVPATTPAAEAHPAAKPAEKK